MLTISASCARCSHSKSIHEIVYGGQPIPGSNGRIREAMIRCTHCNQHSIAVIEALPTVDISPTSPLRGDIDNHRANLRLQRIIPKASVNGAPAHVPAPVAKSFVDGLDVLDSKKWTLAAGAFRTALDRASKVLWGQPDDEMPFKLERRLKELQRRVGIPAAMMDWAEQIRVVGNEMHELDDISEEDAIDVAHFTKMFLTYTFTLPQQVAEFQKRREG